MSETMEGRRRGWLRYATRLLVGASLLTLLLSRTGTPDFGTQSGSRLVVGVGVAASLLLLGQAVAALRWKLVLGAGSPRWGYLARLYLIGSFFSLFLSTVVGGDVLRAAAAAKATRRPGGVIASVVIDRALGVLALLGYALAGLFLAPDLRQRLAEVVRLRLPTAGVIVAVLTGVAAAALGARFAWRSRRVREAAQDAKAAAADLIRAPRTLAAAILLGVVVQGLYILLWLVLALVVRLPVPPTTLLLGVPIVSLLAMLPVTLNGLGVREGAWLVLLGGSGIAEASIVGFSLLFFATNLSTGLLGGFLFVVVGTGDEGKA